MILDENQGATVTPEATEGEGSEGSEETISIPKSEYEKLNQTLGSMKRELKDLKKPKDDSRSEKTPQKTAPEEADLLNRTFLRSAGISKDEEVELALTTARKWDLPLHKLVDDEDFQAKLEKHRTQQANLAATSNVKGDKGGTSAKDTPEYWIAKGTPPSADQVPDRKTRAKIARAMVANAKSGKKFYND